MIESKDIFNLFKIKPKNIELYKMSVVHKSSDVGESYERLEFVGDSIINMITAKYVFYKFRNENEGILTRARTKIVSTQGLSTIASKLGISKFIEMDQTGKENKWNENDKIQEDVLEALIGAIYLDKGFNTTEKVFLGLIKKYVDWDIEINDNYKDLLSSFAHSKGFKKVEYNFVKKENNDHIVQVIIDGIKTCEGTSKQKKTAEQIAAQRALKTLQII